VIGSKAELRSFTNFIPADRMLRFGYSPGAGIEFDSATSSLSLSHAGTPKFDLRSFGVTVGDENGLVVGHTAQESFNLTTSELQVLGGGAPDSAIGIARFSANNSAPTVILGKSRNASVGSYTAVADNDRLGEIKFVGVDSDAADMDTLAGMIRAEVDGAPISGGIPSAISVLTGQDGGSGVAEAVRWDKEQNTIIPATSKLYFDGGTHTYITEEADNRVAMTLNGTTSFYWSSSGGNKFFGIGELSNANMSNGITINQGGADDEIIAFKSSDIAHGITAQTETDTYGTIKKGDASNGLMRLTGYTQATAGIQVMGIGTSANTTKATNARSFVEVVTGIKSGTSVANPTANANLFSIHDFSSYTAKFVVDQEGELFSDGGFATTNMVTLYDGEDDIALSRTFYHAMSDNGARGLVRDRWDDWVKTSEEDLVDIGILGAPLSEGGLVNYSGLSRLNTGAIWQLNTKHMSLVEEVSALRTELAETNRQLAAIIA
jgi:hypothetical protein